MNYFKLILSILFLWLLTHILIISIDGLQDDLQKSDVGVVLGNKVETNGQPSRRLQSRLDRTVELYHEGYFQRIIVSGGVGKEGFDEAKVMKGYLVKKRIPSEKVFLDHAGNNTYLTACNTQRMMKRQKLESVLIISQYYHITRTKLAFSKAGFTKIYSAHARIFELRDVYSLLREVVGYYKYLFLKQSIKV
ncbi:MAG TPA: YdcF family protein [Bacillota bacterium]|nr:YdcF family protein [Bacillota bacterium]